MCFGLVKFLYSSVSFLESGFGVVCPIDVVDKTNFFTSFLTFSSTAIVVCSDEVTKLMASMISSLLVRGCNGLSL